jgi:Cu+-exporting ATPase
MTVEPERAAGQCQHGGRTYYFCSRHCLESFQADPARYVDPAAELPKDDANPGGKYTCPMHPEVVQDGPGSCPKCGMALEPMQPSAEAGSDSELADMARRFWIAAALALPVFLIAMGGLVPWPGLARWLHANMGPFNWLQLVLARRSSCGAAGRSFSGRGRR